MPCATVSICCCPRAERAARARGLSADRPKDTALPRLGRRAHLRGRVDPAQAVCRVTEIWREPPVALDDMAQTPAGARPRSGLRGSIAARLSARAGMTVQHPDKRAQQRGLAGAVGADMHYLARAPRRDRSVQNATFSRSRTSSPLTSSSFRRPR